MNYFSTNLSTILIRSLADMPRHENDESMMAMIQRDLDRTQITDDTVYLSSMGDEASESQSSVRKTKKRTQFDTFFLDYFLTNKENLPYNQGMITGYLVDATILKELGDDQEKVQSFRRNNQDIKFCYQSQEGAWKGVFIKVDIETKAWFGVVTDFSHLKETGPHVAIIGSGEYYSILEKNLRLNPSLMEGAQEPMNDLIENNKLQLYFKYLDTHLTRLKFLEKQESSEKFPKSEVYRQCFRSLDTMGLSQKIMEDKESFLREQEQVTLEEPEKQQRSWNPFRLRR